MRSDKRCHLIFNIEDEQILDMLCESVGQTLSLY